MEKVLNLELTLHALLVGVSRCIDGVRLLWIVTIRFHGQPLDRKKYPNK